MTTSKQTSELEACSKDDDAPHRWEVEPHPYSRDFDYFITDDDIEARTAILETAEMYLWDGNEGEERVLKVRLNKEIPASADKEARLEREGDAKWRVALRMFEKTHTDLVALRQQVEDTILVAQTDVDAEGGITAYHFKTGAIHRLLAEARKGDGPVTEKPWNTSHAAVATPADLRQEAIALCLSVGISDNATNIEQAAELAELDRVLTQARIEDPIGVRLTELALERMDRDEAAAHLPSAVAPTDDADLARWGDVDNWPVGDVLSLLADATEHLLSDHNCDVHGWETFKYAAIAARQHVALLAATPVATPVAAPEGEQEPVRRVDVAANVRWLKANAKDYHGQWVAIKNGGLLDADGSHSALRERIGPTKGTGILITWAGGELESLPVTTQSSDQVARTAAEEILSTFPELKEHDKWVTIGQIRIDRETETETFERAVSPKLPVLEQVTAIISRNLHTAAVPEDELVNEVQCRMDQVVEAAVEWHQAGREGAEWFEAAEKLEATINLLLELRSVPAAPAVTDGFVSTDPKRIDLLPLTPPPLQLKMRGE